MDGSNEEDVVDSLCKRHVPSFSFYQNDVPNDAIFKQPKPIVFRLIRFWFSLPLKQSSGCSCFASIVSLRETNRKVYQKQNNDSNKILPVLLFFDLMLVW